MMKIIQPQPSVKTMLHLFDHLIKPILLYGCEIFTPIDLNFKISQNINNDKHNLINNLRNSIPIIMKHINPDPIEKVHLKFCKTILGVTHKASNLAVYSEIGRYPLFIDQIIHTIKYRNYILYETKNTLIKDFFDEMTKLPGKTTNLHTFSTQLFETLNSKHLQDNKITNHNIYNIKNMMKTQFQKYWFTLLNTDIALSGKRGNNKLRTLKLFKQNYGMEKYLQIRNPSLRKSLCKFRISNHNLKIESLRYNYNNNEYVPPNERICSCCDEGKCEDEEHFLIQCKAFNDKRLILWQKIQLSNPFFTSYSSRNKLIWLMSQEDINLLKDVALFIKSNMEERRG